MIDTAKHTPGLLPALRAAERGITIHYFSPRGHDTSADRDTCVECGENFRHDSHLRVDEGCPADVRATALREVRAAIARATGEQS